ncbi:PREDICTED: FYN-binding protein, partial [Buceros rhinoceros silvestris]|uniref:FYN-binding protein n=1 Tax=Buceros rhinoceros silvestris TaxID=175836 RepID=UPI00052817C1
MTEHHDSTGSFFYCEFSTDVVKLLTYKRSRKNGDGKGRVRKLMEVFEKKASTKDDSESSQPFKVPRQPAHPGLQTSTAAPGKSPNQGNVTSSSAPSTLHKTVDPKPPLEDDPSTHDKTEDNTRPLFLDSVAQIFGVQLQAVNREKGGKAEYTNPPTKTSALAKEEPNPTENKFLKSASHKKEKYPLGTQPKSNFAPQEREAKPAFSKVSTVWETFMSATQQNDPKPSVSRPPLGQKPSLSHDISSKEDTSNKNVFLQKRLLLGPRPITSSFKAAKEMNENRNCAAEAAGSQFSNITLKPTGRWSGSFQGTLKNVEEKTDGKEMSTAKKVFPKKTIQEQSGSSSCKFHEINTDLAGGRPSGGSQEDDDRDRSSGIFKRKTLPPQFKLGQSPQKPSRPPSVDVGNFRKSLPKDSSEKEGLKLMPPSSAAVLLPLPPLHPAVLPRPYLRAPAAPSLPPRNIKPSSETISPDNEENYDDIEFVSQGKMGHGNTEGGQDTDEEMYEDIDIRSSSGKEKKQDKEEKRRMDQEKKEQKEKEKKEQEIRKKFKLTGPIQVLHQARACADHKGGKNELTFKQGDAIEIIRLTDNPEGKWLGRIKGCYGYIKTTMVEIDYDSLRRKQQPSSRPALKHAESDQEVYDDVGDRDAIINQSGDQSGAEKMFPPPPPDVEMYDVVDNEESAMRSVSQDEDKNGIWSWGILKRLKVTHDKKKSVREKTTTVNGAEDNGDLFMASSTEQFGKDCEEDVYDDVDSSEFPPPPPELSASKSASLGKCISDEKDRQKRKTTEKEEREFRKKFRFEGEIKVLYSSTTVQDLPQRRWGSKYLQVKPGESLEIIESTDDMKVLCRNEEGKYGYVLRSSLVE